MRRYNCIIVEDEAPAVELLKSYLSNFENWNLVGHFSDPIEALQYLQSHSVDVLFLDIQLPKLNGMELLQSLKKVPIVVITSAYPEHAVQAFELTVFDYLLKPFPLSRFVQTVQRIHDLEKESRDIRSLIFRENRNNVKIPISDILFIESQREYVVIQHKNGSTKTKSSIVGILQQINDVNFLRIHRSFVIALDKVQAFNQNQVIIAETHIPIGRMYKSEAVKRLTKS